MTHRLAKLPALRGSLWWGALNCQSLWYYLQNYFLLLWVLFCDLNKLFPADFIIASNASFKSVGVQEEENMKFI